MGESTSHLVVLAPAVFSVTMKWSKESLKPTPPLEECSPLCGIDVESIFLLIRRCTKLLFCSLCMMEWKSGLSFHFEFSNFPLYLSWENSQHRTGGYNLWSWSLRETSDDKQFYHCLTTTTSVSSECWRSISIIYGEVVAAAEQEKWFKDTPKRAMKDYSIDHVSWEALTALRNVVKQRAKEIEIKRIKDVEKKREVRKRGCNFLTAQHAQDQLICCFPRYPYLLGLYYSS